MPLNSSMNSMNIGVAGGGLLGRLLAWRLAKLGHQITVFDQDKFATPSGACWIAAGMLSPLSEVVHCPETVFELGIEGLHIWKEWCQELAPTAAKNPYFRKAGSLVVAHNRDLNELEQFYIELKYKLGSLYPDLNLDADNPWCTWLAKPDICNLEPSLTHYSQSLFLKAEGDVNNRFVLTALLQELKNQSVTLVENTKVECDAKCVVNQDRKWAFDLVIDTRGNGAKSQLQGLRSVRGEVLLVESKDVTLNRPIRLMHPRYKLYVVPKPNNQFVIGATEIESSDMSEMSLQSNLELSSALYTLNPAFSEARILEQGVHCRPAMMDNLPTIKTDKGFIQANGLYRHGYLLSPSVVNQVIDLIQRN